MPTMYEIYEKHAKKYHELISAEDYQGNLFEFLRKEISWKGKTVLEAGVGTGRITAAYIEAALRAYCCDRSKHMLDYAKKQLHEYREKIDFLEYDNLNLPELNQPVSIFIEGWSFGHTVNDADTVEMKHQIIEKLLFDVNKKVEKEGEIVLIESLGTNTDDPNPPTESLELFLNELERVFGFKRNVIRTDYRFRSKDEAARIMSFFFGQEKLPEIKKRNSRTIPEWTGVWIKEKL